MLQHLCGTMGTPSIHLRVPKSKGTLHGILTLVFLVEANLCENSSACMDALDVCFVVFLCVCERACAYTFEIKPPPPFPPHSPQKPKGITR